MKSLISRQRAEFFRAWTAIYIWQRQRKHSSMTLKCTMIALTCHGVSQTIFFIHSYSRNVEWTSSELSLHSEESIKHAISHFA